MTVELQAAVRESSSVRRARAAELPRLASALALAFEDDPPTSWVLRFDPRRRRMLEQSFLLYLRTLWFAQDECYTTGSVIGAAIWERPGQWQVPVWRQLTLLPPMALIFRRQLPRMLDAVRTLERGHPREHHYYLPFLGVEPRWQGRGIGAALLAPVLGRCDAEGVPAYLEASTPRNRALYERLGFAVTDEISLGAGAPPVWRMWRAPAG